MSVALAVLAVGVGAAPAEDGVAVIVGNRNYTDERVPEVSYAHRDADAFKHYVVDVLGFDEANVIDLRDATQAEMETAFGNERDHKGKLWSYLSTEGSDVVVYYSGHGVPGLRDRKGYLLPVNANPDTAHLNGYPIDQLYVNLGKLAEASSVRVFLDACFSGGSQGGMLIDAASPVFVSAELPALAGKAMAVLTAASGNQVASWDKDAEHGAFTHHLLDALYGKADIDADGKVTARETKRYLDRHMTRAVRRAYLRDQQAGLHGDGSLVLASAPGGRYPQRPAVAGDDREPFTVSTEPDGASVPRGVFPPRPTLLEGRFMVDGEYLPIIKVAPIYPRRAQTRGIEGHVLVEFIVMTTGAVRNPVVIDAKPPGIFDQAAIQAALRFKYKPEVVNGEPVEVEGVRNLIKFELYDE